MIPAEKNALGFGCLPLPRDTIIRFCSYEESLYQMVCEINRTQVSPADRLTDNVYWYDAVAKQLMAYV